MVTVRPTPGHKMSGEPDDPGWRMSQILIVDPHLLSRRGLRLALESEGFVVDEAAGFEEGLARAMERPPNLVILDVASVGTLGVEQVALFRQRVSVAQVVVLGELDQPEVMAGALRAGACGALLKDCTLGELVDALHLADKGERIVRPEFLRSTLNAILGASDKGQKEAGAEAGGAEAGRNTETPASPLNERECQILQLLADGCTTADVAQRLFLSVHTIRHHLAAIYHRLGVKDRNDAVFRAARLGLIRLR